MKVRVGQGDLPLNPSKRTHRKWADQQSPFFYRCVYIGFELVFGLWVRHYRASGVAHVPQRGGAFVIANHTSALDPFVLGYAMKHRLMCGPGKIELFKNRLVGGLMRRIGIFPVRQGVADAAAVRAMVEFYRAGRIVAVYPEGGRSVSGELRPFFPDFARLMIKLRAPVIPAAITGARDALPVGALVPRPNTAVAVVFGKPFDLSEFYGLKLSKETAEQAAALLEERVRELLPLAESMRRTR